MLFSISFFYKHLILYLKISIPGLTRDIVVFVMVCVASHCCWLKKCYLKVLEKVFLILFIRLFSISEDACSSLCYSSNIIHQVIFPFPICTIGYIPIYSFYHSNMSIVTLSSKHFMSRAAMWSLEQEDQTVSPIG